MHLAPATAHPDDIDLATPEQRLNFLREARAALHRGTLPYGSPLTAEGRDMIGSYVAKTVQSLRPRLVAGTEVL